MSYAISVPTPFNDIAELAESFYSRVDEERLMLPYLESIPEGEWVAFAVTLADGTEALAGKGRCTGSYDNGEDRAPEHRFDVVIDSLEFEEMAQIYFERILQVRASREGNEPATGETAVPPEEGAEDHGEPVAAAAVAEESAATEEHAEAAPTEEHAEAAPAEEYAEAAPAEEYAEAAPAEEYAEAAPAEEHAEAAPAEEHAEVAPAEEYAEAAPAEEYAEAAPAEEHVEAAPAEEHAEPATEEAHVEDPAVEDLESIDAPLVEDAEAADWSEGGDATELGESADAPAAPALSTPTESHIYELPAPSAPGALPSPHGGDAVLTRPFLQATWSPEPLPRFDPSPSSGYFQYAVGAGLPQPAEPPRPDLDPSMHVGPAPRPGDPHVVPAHEAPVEEPQAEAHAEEGAEGYAEEGYAAEGATEGAEEGAVEGGYAEEVAVDGEHAEGEHAAEAGPTEEGNAGDGYAEGEAAGEYAAEVAVEGEYAEEGAAEGEHAAEVAVEGETAEEGAVEGEYAEGESYGDDATLDVDAYGVNAVHDDATAQHDVSGLPDDPELGTETLQVEIPEDDD